VGVLVVNPRDERTQPPLPQDDSQLCDGPEYRCQDELPCHPVLFCSARTRTCSVRLQTRTLPQRRPNAAHSTNRPFSLGILVCRDTCYGFCEGGWARRPGRSVRACLLAATTRPSYNVSYAHFCGNFNCLFRVPLDPKKTEEKYGKIRYVCVCGWRW